MNWFRLSTNLMILTCVLYPFLGCERTPSNTSRNNDSNGLLPITVPTAEKQKPPELKAPRLLESGGTAWIARDELPIQAWYSRYVGQKCVGTSYFAMNPPELSDLNLLRLVHREIFETNTTASGPQRTEIYFESLENLNGQLLSFTETTTALGISKETRGEFLDNALTVTTEVNDKPESISFNWPQGAWGPLGTIATLRQLFKSPTESGQAMIYVRQLNKFVKLELLRSEPELTTLPGGIVKELSLVEIALTSDMGNLKTKNWVSTSGEIVKSVGPYETTMFQITRAEAELIDSEIFVAELLNTSIPISSPIDAFDSPSVVYKIESTNSDPFALFSQQVNQQTKSISARAAEVMVDSLNEKSLLDSDQRADAPDSKCSQASVWIPLDVTSTQLLAQELGGSSSDTLELATKLTQGVYHKLKKETLSRKFVLPAQTTHDLTGDCKAHATLLVALLRTGGIPARIASGLHIVKSRDESQGVFHMWCEAWLGERWLPLDPFLGTVGINADHLKFFESSLSGENPYDTVLPVLQTITQLTVRL